MNKKLKDHVYHTLLEEVCDIVFIKKDGDKRSMKCTLIKDMVPETSYAESRDDHSQVVYDIEKSEWRSFRWDSLKEFNGMHIE